MRKMRRRKKSSRFETPFHEGQLFAYHDYWDDEFGLESDVCVKKKSGKRLCQFVERGAHNGKR